MPNCSFSLGVGCTQFVGRLLAVAVAITTIGFAADSSAWAVGWKPAPEGTGGSINLALAPAQLQTCFGAENYLGWSVPDPVYKFDPRHLERVRFAIRATVAASVSTPENETVRSGDARLRDHGTVNLKSASSVEIVTPITVDMTATDGTTVGVRISFHNFILMTSAGPTIQLLFAVPQYSDIACGRGTAKHG